MIRASHPLADVRRHAAQPFDTPWRVAAGGVVTADVPCDRYAWWTSDEFGDRCDRVIEWLLIVLLAFMPLAFGAVEAWSEEVALTLVAALSICFLARVAAVRNTPLVWTWAYLPVTAFLVVSVLQLLPLPTAAVRVLSPQTALQKIQLLSDIGPADTAPGSLRISFYQHATWHDLRLVLAAAALFVVVLNVYRSSARIMRLLNAVMIIGAGIACLALLQNVAGNGKIYWFVDDPRGNAHAGPFVNHSHYAQFMNLSIGAALGILLVRIEEAFRRRKTTPVAVAEFLGSPEARSIWLIIAVIIVGLTTVFLSMSRGGMISMMVAGAFTTLVLASRKSMRGPAWIMALLALGAFVCMLYLSFDAVYDRLGTLGELHQAQGGRLQILRDVTVAWTRFPILGTGLGTHEVVYPMFDRSTIPAIASHAENEYAQVAEETGSIGLAVLVVFGVLVWVSYARALRGRVPVHLTAYGLGFGLLAVLTHSLSDFGQHLPANGFLAAIFCALLIRLPRVGVGDDQAGEFVLAGGRVRRFGIIVPIVAGLLWGGIVLDADAARRAEAHWAWVLSAERGLTEQNWRGSDDEYKYLLRHAAKAQEYQPGNVKYRHWLNVYRWYAISRETDPDTGNVVLWPQGVDHAGRIADELRQTLRCCPTFGPTWCVLGQLERYVLRLDEQGERHIRKGRQLAPCDATTCLVAGILDMEQGKPEAAFENLRRAVQLDENLYRDVARICIERLNRPSLALELHEDRIHRLVWLADAWKTYGNSHELTAEIEQVNRRIYELLVRQCEQPDAPADALVSLAEIYRRQGDDQKAIPPYRRAVVMNPGRADWHLQLATLLCQEGLLDEAMQEVKNCLRLQPQNQAAERLIRDISVRTRQGGAPPER